MNDDKRLDELKKKQETDTLTPAEEAELSELEQPEGDTPEGAPQGNGNQPK